MENLLHFLSSQGLSDILAALLAVLGGLKVIARYTPWDVDDKVLAALEAPVSYVGSLFKKDNK